MNIKRFESKKFKTNEIALFLTLPLNKETSTKNALIPMILRRGSKNYDNQLKISKKLENMYGAGFNCGIDKTGEYCILKFYIETVANEYLPEDIDLMQDASDMLMDIVFNPLVIDNGFDKDFVEQEKENLKKIIEARSDDKSSYAFNRCIEEMYEDESYSTYKFGRIEDLKNIDEKNLYEHYKKIISECRVDLFVNGIDAKKLKVDDTVGKNRIEVEKYETKFNNEKIVNEEMDVTQGKLVIGLKSDNGDKYALSMYNAILGGGANSKLFQNVREKASLAYSAGSRFIRRKNAIVIITGIGLKNYDKAVKIIKNQIEDMKNGVISDKEFEDAKQLILASLKLIPESQEDMIAFDFDQNLFEENLSFEDYREKIKNVSKEQVIEVAKTLKIDTIYYLKNK